MISYVYNRVQRIIYRPLVDLYRVITGKKINTVSTVSKINEIKIGEVYKFGV